MLSGETLCRSAQIFPPKDLVYFWKKNSNESNRQLKLNKMLIALLYCNNGKSKK